MRPDELVSAKVDLSSNDSQTATPEDLLKGSLVGYDVQMVYDLAQFLNMSGIEFVPIT